MKPMARLTAQDGFEYGHHPTLATARKQILVRGIVQGVGFRPFVHNLARALDLTGYVLNTSEGVRIEVEGYQEALERFISRLGNDAPPLAQIEQISIEDLEAIGETSFVIRQSKSEAEKFGLVSPDVATCSDCWRDFLDPANRRYGYPFTNCTNCGPRYSIIRDIPYDRPTTTMASFRMCGACQGEYDDPADRRYHAQPNACPDCGPTLALVDRDSVGPDVPFEFSSGEMSLQILRDVRRLLREGKILAVKGLGGFHLTCDAENDRAVRELRERKQRIDKPFALMARDLASIESFCIVSKADREALLSPRRPIVILCRRPGANISAAAAPDNPTLGVMLTYTPLHYLLFGETPTEPPAFTALVMTSGNMSEEPIATRNREAFILRPIADWFLLHNRDIYTRVDDSIVRTFEGKERTLRRSRGYAPHPMDLGRELPESLACGAELKSTFCLTKGRYAFLSQHLGDLKNYEALVFFQETLDRMQKLFRVRPRAVAHDLHPLYLSTKLARELEGVEKIGVQHHHAHIASCMAENELRDKVIGIAFDGVGYGTDGAIWGGEFMIADFSAFERRAHLRYVPLPGGDMSTREPWRMALSYLQETFGAESNSMDLPLWREISPKKLALVQAMILRGASCVRTSSCGRLFDAVASILGLRHETNFEAQAAIALEMAADPRTGAAYPFEIDAGDPWEIDVRPAIASIVRDRLRGKDAGSIAARFHNTLVAAIVEVCRRLRGREGLNRVCLSGGTFQNVYLLARAAEGLRRHGFAVFTHCKVPPNDGGISLGQAVIASETVRRGEANVPGYTR